MTLRYLSICSGIEAASVAWEPLGWEAVGFSEIEPFPRAVLAHRFPHVPLHGDFTELIKDPPSCDVLVGGTPCTAFSVAGLRRSLDDALGNLTLAYVMLADAIDRRNREEGKEPCITVWENVPGVFSTKDNAFGFFLRGLAGSLPGEDGPLEPPGGKWTHCGLVSGPTRTICWRVQDAQYFGLAQRRQRVFVVASAREGFDPAAVLLEWEGVRRDSAPSREARQNPAAASGVGVEERGGAGEYLGNAEGGAVDAPFLKTSNIGKTVNNQTLLVGDFPWPQEVDDPLTSNEAKTYTQEGSHNFRTRNVVASDPFVFPIQECNVSRANLRGTGTGLGKEGDVMFTLQAAQPHGVVAASQDPFVFDTTQVTSPENRCKPQPGDPSHPLAAAGHPPTLAASVGDRRMVVRRLTPRECERLQGFPDDFSLIPWKGKPAVDCPDGPRYKALGNSMAVPVMRWIGRRIDAHLKGAL